MSACKMMNMHLEKEQDMHVDEAYRACCWSRHTCCNVLTFELSLCPYKLWTLTCTIRVPTLMVHAHSAHLFAHATDPRTLDLIVLPDGRTHALRKALRCPFLTQTTPTPPLDAPKKHFVRSETHQIDKDVSTSNLTLHPFLSFLLASLNSPKSSTNEPSYSRACYVYYYTC